MGSYIFHGLLYSQKKIIMALDFSQRLLQKSLRTKFKRKIHLSFSTFCQFSSSLFQALSSDSEESAKVWKMGTRERGAKREAGREKRKKEVSSRFFFFFALSQFYGPDDLGA